MKVDGPNPNQPRPITGPDPASKKTGGSEAGETKQKPLESLDTELSKVADHRAKTQSSRISKLSTDPKGDGANVKPSQVKILVSAARSDRPGSALQEVVDQLKSGDLDAAKQEWTKSVGDMVAKGMPVDVNSLVNSVLRQAYLEGNEDLKSFADKVKHFNEVKGEIRDSIGESRRPSVDHSSDSLSDHLNPIGNDAQLANLDLQNMVQKQAQTLQLMSNASRALNESAMAMIRKMRG